MSHKESFEYAYKILLDSRTRSDRRHGEALEGRLKTIKVIDQKADRMVTVTYVSEFACLLEVTGMGVPSAVSILASAKYVDALIRMLLDAVYE